MRVAHPVRPVVGHGERLGETLRLVVAPAGSDRVDVAPVVLGLRMDQWIAITLAGRGEEKAAFFSRARPQGVVRPERPDLERLDRILEVVDRAGGRGEMKHIIDVIRQIR